ncbi:CheR family methyltransferase [Methylobacterium planeticum]|uniref:protein-glutamate O-methyltransferase n=1 Tax=Methylobacterium planeticum TaxID=2615211 RepID=A0A6N6MNF9_9HYPH|nr:protein-glutamate O-methyltransferase CheR [Methylobacterium planeticum]KAB1071471.1 protein-glutamate methyltransferase [Methylobacterium planeticum]
MRKAARRDPHGDPGYAALKARIIARTGHHYYADKDDLLFDRLRRRFKACGVPDSGAYLAHLEDRRTGPREWAALESEITIGETFFFRYAEQFEALRDTILPGLIAARQADVTLRVWSAGCSTGAEPYSLAILLHELLGAALPDWHVAITGTDISHAALATARAAEYGRWAMRTLPPEERQRYFLRLPAQPGPAREGTYVLRPEFRRMVRFERQNLMSLIEAGGPAPTPDFDLILCRNVLIYFHADTVAAIVRALSRRLRPGGWLLIGHAEPNPAFAGWLAPVNLPGTVAYRRREDGAEVLVARLPPPEALAATGPAAPPARAPVAPPALPAEPVPPAATDGPDRAVPPAAPAPAILPDPAAAIRVPPDLVGDGLPLPPDEILARIRTLADAGETAEAWRSTRAALTETPTDARLRFYEGLLARSLGREAEAERSLRAALYLDRGFVMAHYHLGLLLASAGRLPAARRALDNAAGLAQALLPDTAVPEGDGAKARQVAESARLARAGLS